MATHPVAIHGASGYLGRQLLALLHEHPHLEPALAGSRSHAGEPVGEVVPSLAPLDLTFTDPDLADLADHDAVLLALPSEASADLVPDLLEAGAETLVDLSGAHRLRDPDARAEHYPSAPEPGSPEAAYGFAEGPGGDLAEAALVANPGCYPTGALAAALPLLQGLEIADLHVTSVSGVTGAGATPTETTHFPAVQGSVTAYDVAGHRHTPEIQQEATRLAGHPVGVTFVPHLAPMNRGIHTTLVAPGAGQGLTQHETEALYGKVLEAHPFLRLVDHAPDPAHVRGTNAVEVRPHVDGDDVTVTAAHDNLVKGGAGQAVQNLNRLLGYPAPIGLPSVGGAP
jgi:N-acetyl-gamma-glutamyl-phosphate reductase